MAEFVTSHIVTGILECDPATKQDLGRRLAGHLRLQEGVAGRDDGIDGIAIFDDKRVLFQAKLRSNLIGPDDAKIFWADLIRHRMTGGIYLAGMGYSEEFHRVSRQLDGIMRETGRPISSFLLTLADIFDKTEALRQAAGILPPIADVDRVMAAGAPLEGD